MNQLLKAALWYQEHGYSVIPVKKNKKPFIKWEKYQSEQADSDQIEAWWKKWPSANIGLVTGAVSGVMVVDADSEAGIDAVNQFIPDSLLLPTSNTPKGGQHFFFKHRPGLSNGVRVITEADFRTDGGYVLAPPSNNGNGKSYTWNPNLKINEVDPPPMPDFLYDALQQGSAAMPASAREQSNKVKSYTKESSIYKAQHSGPQQSITNRNIRNISLDKGSRDESLFHIANCLHRGGMDKDNILNCLNILGSCCNPPFPEKEISVKVQSVLKRSKNKNRNLTAEVREWVSATWGNITATEALQNITNATFEDRKKIRVILGRLVNEGVLERDSKKNGVYRKVDDVCEAEDWQNAEARSVGLWLPFELNEMIEIPPGSIILFAGSQDAGKSATMMNIARENMRKWNVHYFSSELNASAFKMRTSKFVDISPDQWDLKFYQRSDNFHDVIKTGPNDLNIIDYLEVHTEFYLVAKYLAEIHRKIGDGVAVVALQKDPQALYGRGGSFTQEKPVLSVALDHGKATISKFKGQFKGENPREKQYRFKLVDGCKFIKTQGWHRPQVGR